MLETLKHFVRRLFQKEQHYDLRDEDYPVYGPDIDIHIRVSEYVFEGIPYMGISKWRFSYPESFAIWKATLHDSDSVDEVIDRFRQSLSNRMLVR